MKTRRSNIEEQAGRDSSSSRLIVWLVGLFTVGNMVLVTASHAVPNEFVGALLTGCWMGAAAAQIALHSIWTVYSRDTLRRRGLSSLVVALLLLVSIVGVDVWAGRPWNSVFDRDWVVVYLCCMPLVLFGCQFPLWILYAGAGWRLLRPNESLVHGPGCSIRGLLVATALIGFAIALVRLASSMENMGRFTPDEFVFRVLGFAAIAACSTVAGVLSLFVTLVAQRVRRGVGCVAVIGSTPLVITALVWAGLTQDEAQGFAVFSCGALTCLVSTIAPLLVVRRLGYRVVRGPSG